MSTTSELNDEKKRIARRFVQELLLRNWDFCSNTKGISLWTTLTEMTDKKAVKVVVFISSVTLEDIDAVACDISLVSKFDKYTEAKTEVKSITDTLKVYRTTFRSPIFGIAPRELVTREALSYYPSPAERAEIGLLWADEREERNILLHVAEDATEELAVTPKYQRGRAFIAGLVAEQVDSGVRVVFCAVTDPCGSLPQFILDYSITLQVQKVEKFVEHVKQRAAVRTKTS